MKLFDLYKKLTLANLLSLTAMRLFKLSRLFCSKLMAYAIRLDPHRALFRSHLITLGVSHDDTTKKTQKQEIRFYSISEGCELLSQKINFVETNRTIALSLPAVINPDFVVPEKYACEAKLPDTYLAELNNATVFASTDLIVVQDMALYDEIDRHAIDQYGIKTRLIEKISSDTLILKTPITTLDRTLPSGIHFAKDYSKNYFHWLIECLPRLSLISQLDKRIPLLVDEDIYPQALEALTLLNSDKRPLIKLQSQMAYKIKKLYYPSQLSVVHDNYQHPLYHKDVVYSPDAIHFVKNSVFQKLNIKPQQPFRKIYLSRKASTHRQLLNSTEIENFLATQGFEVIFPEHLSFHAQVHIFSEAKIIIGQSGAGMANFIFAPQGCKVLMMFNGAPECNMHIFGALAKTIDLDIEFLLGRMSFIIPHVPILHNDFHVDMNLLVDFLDHNNFLKE